MSEQPALDFGKVESLRKHMLLTTQQLCKLFGVSRMTYYGWLKGKNIRKHNDFKVRRRLRQLLAVMHEHEWPTPDVIGVSSVERFEKLKKLLGEDE
jgi:transcriptional regulator with XRE-family HTH domain